MLVNDRRFFIYNFGRDATEDEAAEDEAAENGDFGREAAEMKHPRTKLMEPLRTTIYQVHLWTSAAAISKWLCKRFKNSPSTIR